MRITLDSNVLVRAVVSPYGPALALLDAVLNDHTLVLSRFILDELERVLMYPRIQARYRVTPHEAAAFAARLGEAAYMVEPVILEPVIPSTLTTTPFFTPLRMLTPKFSAPSTQSTSVRPKQPRSVRFAAFVF